MRLEALVPISKVLDLGHHQAVWEGGHGGDEKGCGVQGRQFLGKKHRASSASPINNFADGQQISNAAMQAFPTWPAGSNVYCRIAKKSASEISASESPREWTHTSGV